MSFSDVSEDQNELGSKAEEPEDLENTPGRKTVMSEAIKKFMSLTQSPYSDAEFLPETPSGAEVPSAKSARSSLGSPTSVPPESAYIAIEQLMKKEWTKLEKKMREDCEVKLEKELKKARAAKQDDMEAELKEHDETISQLVAQKDMLMKERDKAMQDLNKMEIAFIVVHQKYERSKTVIKGMKANEDLLKKILSKYEDIKTSNANYESLIKQFITDYQEQDLIHRSHQAEVAKLKAEVRVTSLEESLEQKSKEDQELAAIYDELIQTQYNNFQ